jgi:hypothetical protein
VRKSHYIIAAGIAVFFLAVGLFFFLDFRGNLDRGKFEVLRTVKNSENTIAIVGKRSDHDALNGDNYFVLLADHIYSPKELRAAYYRDRSRMIFRANRDGLDVQWPGPHELVIECKNCEIFRDRNVNEQRFKSGDISVRYVDFP